MISIIIPAAREFDPQTSRFAILFSALNQGPDYEVIVVPNHTDSARQAAAYASYQRSPGFFPNLRVVAPPEMPGKGSAIKHGLRFCRGDAVMFIDDDIPFDSSCIRGIIDTFSKGEADWVTGMRFSRKAFGQFSREVKKASSFRRFCGKLFFSMVRNLFGIRAGDTQCGMKIMTRDFAQRAFHCVSSAGFYFDVELFIFSSVNKARHADYPVTVVSGGEESTISFRKELPLMFVRILQIHRRYRKGRYHMIDWRHNHLTADDWGLNPAVNDAILELARQGIVTRVGILPEMGATAYRLKELQDLPVSIGLHFNLTEKQEPVSRGRLFFQLLFGFKSSREIAAELRHQLQALQMLNLKVQYVDGHEHVHIFPGVLRAAAPVLAEFGITQMRLPYDRRLWFTRLFPLALMSLLNKKEMLRHRLHFRNFLYPQARDWKDPERLRKLIAASPHTEIVAHPALTDLQGDNLGRREQFDRLAALQVQK